MLTLSWSDGNTLIPVNSCLLASAKDTNIIGPVKEFDNRTLAGKRRQLAQTKAPEAMMTLLDTALSAGLNADYVLFDSWFSNPAQITAIHSKGIDVIATKKSIPGTKSAAADQNICFLLTLWLEKRIRFQQKSSA